jgi:hypothetical protein
VQGEVHGALGVQPGGVEDRDGGVFGPDEQVNLGATEQDAFGTPGGKSAMIRRYSVRESSAMTPTQSSS